MVYKLLLLAYRPIAGRSQDILKKVFKVLGVTLI
jgi:hypothetical protein